MLSVCPYYVFQNISKCSLQKCTRKCCIQIPMNTNEMKLVNMQRMDVFNASVIFFLSPKRFWTHTCYKRRSLVIGSLKRRLIPGVSQYFSSSL